MTDAQTATPAQDSLPAQPQPAARPLSRAERLAQYQHETALAYSALKGEPSSQKDLDRELDKRMGVRRDNWAEADFQRALSEVAPALREELLGSRQVSRGPRDPRLSTQASEREARGPKQGPAKASTEAAPSSASGDDANGDKQARPQDKKERTLSATEGLGNVIQLPHEVRKAMDVVDLLAASPRVESPERAKAHAEDAQRSTEQQVQLAKQAREVAKESPKLERFAPVPTHSPRTAELEQALRPASARDLPGTERLAPYHQLDRAVRGTLREVTSNPLWLAADHVARNPGLKKVDDLVAGSAAIAEAKSAYRQAESAFVQAKRDLEAFSKKPKWLQKLANFFAGRGEHLRNAHDEAARNLLDHKGQIDRVSAEERYRIEDEVRDFNADALARQTEAKTVRNELEQPLRNAALSRYIAEQALTNGYALERFANAQRGQTLTYAGERPIGGATFHELRAAGGRTYLADALDPASGLGQLGLLRGETVRLVAQEHGGVTLEKRQTREGLTLSERPLVGELGAVVWKDDKLEKLQLKSPQGKTDWVYPRGVGGDLAQELGCRNGAKLILDTGATVRLYLGGISVLCQSPTRAQAQGHGR